MDGATKGGGQGSCADACSVPAQNLGTKDAKVARGDHSVPVRSDGADAADGPLEMRADAVQDWDEEAKRHCTESVDALLDDAERFLQCAVERRRMGETRLSQARNKVSQNAHAEEQLAISRHWLERAQRDLLYLGRLADATNDISRLSEQEKQLIFR